MFCPADGRGLGHTVKPMDCIRLSWVHYCAKQWRSEWGISLIPMTNAVWLFDVCPRLFWRDVNLPIIACKPVGTPLPHCSSLSSLSSLSAAAAASSLVAYQFCIMSTSKTHLLDTALRPKITAAFDNNSTANNCDNIKSRYYRQVGSFNTVTILLSAP